MTNYEFTFDEYESIITGIQSQDYIWRDFEDGVPPKTVIHRHDIDYHPQKALRIAKLENELGITGTYFVLVSSSFYNVFDPEVRKILQEIELLGHSVELHFDSWSYWDKEPNEGELGKRVEAECEVLETAIDTTVSVVALHNPPDWALNREFDGFTSTYEPRFFEDIEYVSDSNQRWRSSDPFDRRLGDRFQLLIHPVMWGENPGDVHDRLSDFRESRCRDLGDEIANENQVWDETS